MDVVGGCNGEEERGNSDYLRKRAQAAINAGIASAGTERDLAGQ